MRKESLNHPRSRIKGVKEYCEANREELIGCLSLCLLESLLLFPQCISFAMPRWDKYENKPKYWYEEDLEMEWVKQKQRSATTATEMESRKTGENLAKDMSAPMRMDMDLAKRGQRF